MSITIGAYEIIDYQGSGSTVEFRWYASRSWTDIDGDRHIRGEINSPSESQAYLLVAGTIVGTTLQMPSHDTPTTNDAIDRNDVKVSLAVYIDGKYYTTLLKKVEISTELGSSTSIENIRSYNKQTIHHTPEESFQRDVWAYLATLSLAPLASYGQIGRSRLSADPLYAGDPIAVSANDPRVKDNLLNYASLDAAITALTGIPCILQVNANTAISANKTIPVEICIEFGSRGKFTPAANVAVTINSMVDAGDRQVFDCAASNSKILFGEAAVPHINIAWFCGVGSSVNAKRAIDIALESTALNSGGRIFIPNAGYYTSGAHVMTDGVTVFGTGNRATTGAGGTRLKLIAPVSTYMFKIGEGQYSNRFENILLDGTGTTSKDAVLFEGTYPNTSGDVFFQKVTFNEFGNGVNYNDVEVGMDVEWQMAQVRFDHCIFQQCVTGLRSTSLNSQFTFTSTNWSIPASGVGIHANGIGATTVMGAEIAGAGASSKFIVIDAAHVQINLIGNQDENVGTVIENNASDNSGIVNLFGCLVQGKIQINASCVINSVGNSYLSRAFKFGGIGTIASISSKGDYIRQNSVDDYPTLINPPSLTEGGINDIHIVSQENPILEYYAQRLRQRFISPITDVGNPSVPVLETLHVPDATDEDKVLWRFGRADTDESALYYCDLKRIYSTGWFNFVANQIAPFKGFSFNAPVATTVDHAYVQAQWDGLLEFPTKNAVSDELEVIRALATSKAAKAGDTFTGAVAAPSIALGGGTAITKVIRGTVTIDPASLAAATAATETVTITGAVVGDSIVINPPAAGLTAGLLMLQAYVSAANTVKVVLYNSTGAPIDEASASWNYLITRS